MKKIYLFCSAGMSTSILANKMQEVAHIHNVLVEVKAYPYHKLEEIIKKQSPDCILLGPQIKYLYQKVMDAFGNTGIPIAVIDAKDYGMMNGEKVLKIAIQMMEEIIYKCE